MRLSMQLSCSKRDDAISVDCVKHVDPAERITALHIIYDTVEVRPVFEAEVGRPSWRPHT